MSGIHIDQKTIGYYRAVTATGWAAYCRATGRTRPATRQEAAVAEDLSAPPARPVEVEA